MFLFLASGGSSSVKYELCPFNVGVSVKTLNILFGWGLKESDWLLIEIYMASRWVFVFV